MGSVAAVAVAALLLAACQFQGSTPEYTVTTVALPNGDPEAGRRVFTEMGCASCHRVAWDAGLPAPVSPVPAPVLAGELASLTAGVVATSIIAPSHFINLEAEPVEGELSPMGDFTEAMTVRQLIDVVSYVRSGSQRVAVHSVQDSLPAAAR